MTLVEQVSSVAARIRYEADDQPPHVAGALLSVLKAAKGFLSLGTAKAVSDVSFDKPGPSKASVIEDVEALKVRLEKEGTHLPGTSGLLAAIEGLESTMTTEDSLRRPPPRDRGMAPERGEPGPFRTAG